MYTDVNQCKQTSSPVNFKLIFDRWPNSDLDINKSLLLSIEKIDAMLHILHIYNTNLAPNGFFFFFLFNAISDRVDMLKYGAHEHKNPNNFEHTHKL